MEKKIILRSAAKKDMEEPHTYGTAIGYFIPNPEYIKPGEYKRTSLDDAKDKADMLLQSIDGNYYTLKLNRPIEVKGRGVKRYSANIENSKIK